MLRRKKLNKIRRDREHEQRLELERQLRLEEAAKRRARLKFLKETKQTRIEKFRKEYSEMIHMEPHISTPQSIQGIAPKKKSVLEKGC